MSAIITEANEHLLECGVLRNCYPECDIQSHVDVFPSISALKPRWRDANTVDDELLWLKGCIASGTFASERMGCKKKRENTEPCGLGLRKSGTVLFCL